MEFSDPYVKDGVVVIDVTTDETDLARNLLRCIEELGFHFVFASIAPEGATGESLLSLSDSLTPKQGKELCELAGKFLGELNQFRPVLPVDRVEN